MLVDTGAWYALADLTDRHHSATEEFYLAESPGGRFMTTELIVSATRALLTACLGRQAALDFWQALRDSRIPIVPVEGPDLEAAWRIAQSHPDQVFSLADCASFVVMERLGTHEAFACDSHSLVYRFGSDRQRSVRRLP